jgi:hypothetical protein
MKRVLLVLLIAMIAIPTFQSCKKYENGPTISLRSKKSRVANDWAISSYQEGGIDKTTERINDDMTLTKSGEATYHQNNSGLIYTMVGTWEFDESKERIKILASYTRDDGAGNNIIVSVVEDMKVTKLKEKEMWWDGTVSQTLPAGYTWGTSSNVMTYAVKTKFKAR